MRVLFFGTSAFAVPALERIVREHEIVAVVTQPPRPRGRGRRPSPSPIEETARRLQLKVLTPDDPNAKDFLSTLAAFQPEIGVLVSYGCILQQSLLDLPPRGFVNLHPSLLPAYRGAAPIQRALMDGCTETGVSVIVMRRKVDAGDILAQRNVSIGTEETAGELSARLAAIGAELLADTLFRLEKNRIQATPQDSSRATPAPKIKDSERLIRWSRPATALHNLIRALSPTPAAYTFFRSRRILVLRSRLIALPSCEPPGTILTSYPGLAVTTGAGTLELLEVKPESGRPQSGQSFRNGYRPTPGEKFTNT